MSLTKIGTKSSCRLPHKNQIRFHVMFCDEICGRTGDLCYRYKESHRQIQQLGSTVYHTPIHLE